MAQRTGSVKVHKWNGFENKSAPFSSHYNVSYPISVLAKGLSGSEEIIIEAFIGPGDPDSLNDAQWIPISFEGTQQILKTDNNMVSINGIGIYRLKLAVTPATLVSIFYFDYGS